jgi:hypothetical protein
MQRLIPHFLRGGPGYIAEVVDPLMEDFTHFQEEAGHRALDWRDIPKPYVTNRAAGTSTLVAAIHIKSSP